MEFDWHAPNSVNDLLTTPGFQLDPSFPVPSDAVVRFITSHITQQTRKGGRFSSGEELDKYIENPVGAEVYIAAPKNVFRFPISSTASPEFSKISGMQPCIDHLNNQLGILVFNKGKRKGQSIDLQQRQMKRVSNSPSAAPKFSGTSHPFFELSPNALPPGTPELVLNQARASFSCSITKNSQSNYATAVRHKRDAEAKLGRNFSIPMTNSERAFFTTYLIGKGLKKATISGYLSALRFYELAKGADKPCENSELTKHLLLGHANASRDPRKAVYEKQRRPITGKILQLLGHSIASSSKPDFEKSLIWAVCTTAFWGSFRISELLCESKHAFNEKFSLMPSDLHINAESIGIWLRSEKVPSEFGNIVEIWGLPERVELDPVLALKGYLDRRSDMGNVATGLPVFIHRDGSNFTKAEFNNTLKELLSIYPDLSSSNQDFWGGHSFRSGLSTLLQGLGFDENAIKAWGRWKSQAYLAYLKDMTHRRETRARLTSTFSDILKNL